MTGFPRASRNERDVPCDWELMVLGQTGLTWVSICVLPTDTPSSPSIDQVEPYSSTAQVQFDEPEATGGVPILKYKAEWRAVGEEVWHSKWYDAKEGELGESVFPLGSRVPWYSDVPTCHPVHVPTELGTAPPELGQSHICL